MLEKLSKIVHCKQVRGPSTPLGYRLAALRMTDQKIAGDWRLTSSRRTKLANHAAKIRNLKSLLPPRPMVK